MSTRPLIAITCSTASPDRYPSGSQDRLGRAYASAIWKAGGAPILIPNLCEDGYPEALLARVDGLLLSGGDDVGPDRFGEEILNDTVEVDHARDAAEIPLARTAVARDIPILGICRGIQTLAVALGGTLYQDIPAQVPEACIHRQTAPRPEATHEIRAAGDCRLYAITGQERLAVNTFHHQAVRGVPKPLRPTAWAPDGVIECVEAPDAAFLIGVQYHPEEMTETQEHAMKLFAAFVQTAGRSRR